MANSVASFVLGALTVLVLIAGVYIYMDFTKSKKTVADYSTSPTGSDTYIYDKGDKVMENAIGDSIDKNLAPDVIPTKQGTISGTVCYPSEILPSGEVVAKNTATNITTKFDIDGTATNYKLQVEPGTYHVRYQAHASGDATFTSGYYTKCGIDSSAEVCNAPDGHDLIPVTVSPGEVKENVRACDFYYTDEPSF